MNEFNLGDIFIFKGIKAQILGPIFLVSSPQISVNSWGYEIIGISQLIKTIRLRENFAYEIRQYMILHQVHFYRKEVIVMGLNSHMIIFLQKFIKACNVILVYDP